MWSGFVGIKFIVAVCTLGGISWLISSRIIGPEHLHLEHEDKAAREYLSRALPKIIGTWDFAALEERITSELQVSENWKSMPAKFKLYRKNLGPVLEYRDTAGSIEFDDSSGSEVTIGTFSQRVDFKRGIADVATVVVKRNNTWRFARFSVRSAVLPASLDDDQ